MRKAGLVRVHVSTKHADLEHVVHCGRYFPLRHLEKIVRYGPWWSRKVQRAPKFCFLRHPLSWYESWWRYMSGRGWRKRRAIAEVTAASAQAMPKPHSTNVAANCGKVMSGWKPCMRML